MKRLGFPLCNLQQSQIIWALSYQKKDGCQWMGPTHQWTFWYDKDQDHFGTDFDVVIFNSSFSQVHCNKKMLNQLGESMFEGLV